MKKEDFKSKLKQDILIIEEGKEITIPQGYTMVYLERDGKIVLCKDNIMQDDEYRSSHFYAAEKYYNVQIPEGREEAVGLNKVISKGNIAILEIGDEDIYLVYREKSITPKQQKRIQEFQEKNYNIIYEEVKEQRLMETIDEECLPVLIEIEEKENNEESEEKNKNIRKQIGFNPAII